MVTLKKLRSSRLIDITNSQNIMKIIRNQQTEDKEDNISQKKCSTKRKRKTYHKEEIGTNAARERSRVQQLRDAFIDLQKSLPNVPEGTKLSKLDILLLTIDYISHLMSKLSDTNRENHLKRLKSERHPTKVSYLYRS